MPLPAAALAAVYALAGVPISVTGPSLVLPMPPDPMHMEVIDPTTAIDAGTSVLMSDQTRWVVKAKRTMGSGAVQVALRPLTMNVLTTLTIPADALSTPIWWVRDVQEEPPGEDIPADVPGDDDVPPTDEPPQEG